MTLSKMSGPKLEAHKEAMFRASCAATKEAIAQGLGHVRGDEMPAIAAADDRPRNRAAQACIDTDRAFFAAVNELEERRRYHGSAKPIRRAS